MSFPYSHKTVFVLDHSSHFSAPCQQVEYDVGRRGGLGSGCIPLAPISKSVWTVVVEAVAEYCRIVWDLYHPQDRLIRVVVAAAGEGEVQVLGWGQDTQSTASVLTSLASVGRPGGQESGQAPSILQGISLGLEALSEPSARQQEMGEGAVNRGRLVVVTRLESDREHQQLLRGVTEQLAAVNKRAAAAGGQGQMPIQGCELVILSTGVGLPEGRLRTECDQVVELSPVLSTLLYSVAAGPLLTSKLLYLCLKHYNLASTTVTGIPMKEEQNASSSANYDVELFHQAESHEKLVGEVSDMVYARRQGCEYPTATLKWCTPRGSAMVELHHCSATHRVTPVEVNSRQSSCLTNFLLSGRSVMLEMVKQTSNTKTISHMLTSHGGEIFIHTLSCSRSVLEEPPSISEGPGGRVTDYRIPDLAELMKGNRLAPWPGEEGQPGEAAKARMDRATKVFPLTISSTTIFNMPSLSSLVTLLQGDALSEEQVAECRKMIYSLMSMEAKGDPLPGPLSVTGSSGNPKKSGGARKEEQYRMMFLELEKYVTAHSSNSSKHHTVLECLMEVRNKPLPVVKQEPEGEAAIAGRELERYSSMTERERQEFNLATSIERKEKAGSGSPQPKKAKMMGLNGASLLEIYKARLEREAAKKHVEFAGRRNLGEIAKLYIKLEKDNGIKQEESVK